MAAPVVASAVLVPTAVLPAVVAASVPASVLPVDVAASVPTRHVNAPICCLNRQARARLQSGGGVPSTRYCTMCCTLARVKRMRERLAKAAERGAGERRGLLVGHGLSLARGLSSKQRLALPLEDELGVSCRCRLLVDGVRGVVAMLSARVARKAALLLCTQVPLVLALPRLALWTVVRNGQCGATTALAARPTHQTSPCRLVADTGGPRWWVTLVVTRCNSL